MDKILMLHHILAVGCNKRFMFVATTDDVLYCVRISDGMYKHLKSLGVPTSQKLRYLRSGN